MATECDRRRQSDEWVVMSQRVYFDESLPLLVKKVAGALGPQALSRGVILRDPSGRLAFFCPPGVSEPDAEQLEREVRETLQAYASPEVAVVLPNALGAESIRRDNTARRVKVEGFEISLLDRRLVGADWLRTPSPAAGPPARFVFASLKGGVGRSTAICISAAHLASQGLRVLAIDLDLEAPGLDVLLLSEETLPDFGVVDALVENGLGDLPEIFFTNMLGPCALATAGGRIDVLPAFGKRSRKNPASVMAKLARAYSEDITSDGSVATVLDQVSSIVERIATPDQYDAVLVDVRAGLHETSASAIIGLGAEVFLFGRDEAQTFQGYSFLLSHLSILLQPGGAEPEWLDRLTPVQALAAVDPSSRIAFAQRWETMVRDTGLTRTQQAPAAVPLPDGFLDVPWEDDQPDEEVLPDDASLLNPIAILRNSDYDAFDPQGRQDLLARRLYDVVFGDLLARLDAATSNRSGGS